ncbi:MAG: DUF4160 domain-containing protein [Cellulosilyticaceae bacterium]
MPKIMVLFGYQISIWSNENGEPIHVHVSKGRPTQNATKLWLLSDGTFSLAHNKSRVPEQELKKIILALNVNKMVIYSAWMNFHGYEKYYQ